MNKLACALFAFASIGIASAQKVAVINSQKAVLETAEIKKAQVDLETKFKPRQDKVIQIQKDLETIRVQLQSGKLNAMGNRN
jgi:outer membrane protein